MEYIIYFFKKNKKNKINQDILVKLRNNLYCERRAEKKSRYY